jgi:glycogen debranching enzyme
MSINNFLKGISMLPFPELKTSNPVINRAYRIATGDLLSNIRLFRDGLLEQPAPALLAGLDYDTPWTRDTAINVWNGISLFWPEVARNTLLSVLERKQNDVYISGQYWDAIIWAIGAWTYYLHTSEKEFLTLALEAVKNSLEYFEQTEFDAQFGLFCGPAVYGDGVSAYPDRYSPGGTSSILDWVKFNPEKKVDRGFGIPMMTLSTNCIYAKAYRIADLMSRELGLVSNSIFQERSDKLAKSIQKHFWNSEREIFNYLIDLDGACDFQEGLGHAFALLFDIANPEQAHSVLQNQHITPAGIPCVWPTFSRYSTFGEFGRHSGTVWPFISGFWGEAALKYDRPDLFDREFMTFTNNINQHAQCAEIYHPETGDIYGGLQEAGSGPRGMDWTSCSRQSWTASAYLRMLLNGLLGMRFDVDGIIFAPHLPAGVDSIAVSGINYRGCRLSLTVEGRGGHVVKCYRTGSESEPFLSADTQGEQEIQLHLTE